MDLKIFHDTVRYFINKEQGGWLSPEEIDNLTDRAQMWYFTESVPYYGKSQKTTDPLAVFSKRVNFTTPVTGLLTLPTDYETLPVVSAQYFDSRVRYKPIKLLSEDEITERRDSQVLQPTVSDPVGIETHPGVIQLYPEAVISGYCTYLKRPAKPVFKYTATGRSIVYDQAGSTQLEWNESSINKILVKTIQMFGVNLSDQMVIQYTEMKNSQDI